MRKEQITDDGIVEAGERPRLQELIADYKSCTPWSGYGWNNLTTNEEIRHALWAGQSATGKKEDALLQATTQKPAFPFDGASDARIFLADEIINQLVALWYVGFQRAAAAQKMSLDEERGYALKLLDYYIHEVMHETLAEQVELSGQYRGTYGLFFLNARWVREVQLERTRVGLDQLLLAFEALSQGAGPQRAREGARPAPTPTLQGFPDAQTFLQMLQDPEADRETAEVLKALYEITAGQRMEGYGYSKVEMPGLSDKTLRQAVKDLREEGEATVPMPYLCRNEPEIVALKPWDEVVLNGSVADLRKARVYHREFVDEVTLRRRIVERGWSEEWVRQALKYKGKVSAWGDLRTGSSAQVPSYDPSRFAETTFTMQESKNELVEIVYATYWALDGDNVPCVYCTVFHPEVGGTDGRNALASVASRGADAGVDRGSYAEHGVLEEGFIPYVAGRREVRSPQITSSRAVPEIATGWQRLKKVTFDGSLDLLSMAVLPPLNKYASALGVNYKFGPGVQNTVQPGREPRFMEVPTKGLTASHEMVDRVDREARRYFGLIDETVPPLLTQLMQQWQMSTFLVPWTAAFQMVLDLAKCNMPDAEFAKVTGAPPGWLDSKREEKGLFRSVLHLDVRELDPEYVEKMFTMINTQILPGDVGGVIDRNMLVQVMMHTLNPTLARVLIRSDQAASQKMFQEVNNEIALMYLGNLPQLVENDPTAKNKLQYATQIVQSNPKYQQELQRMELAQGKVQPSRFAQLMEAYVKNLGFSVTQQENKQVGRVGVDITQLEG